MKKFGLMLLACILLLGAAACEQDLPAGGTAEMSPSPEPDVVTVVDIIDRTETEPLVTADALEGFWSDEEYHYYFSSIKSQYIIVHYSDGTQEPVRDAMGAGRVTLADLDRFGIGYYKEEIVTAVGMECKEGVLDALGLFWSDEQYDYYFPCMDTEVTVLLSDGHRWPLQDALMAELVTVSDLDRYGIQYLKYFAVRVADIVDRTETEPLGTPDGLEGFWSDGEYAYYFGSIKSQYVVVRYNNGAEEPLRNALEGGRVTMADLDRFGIGYSKRPAVTVTDIEFKAGMDTAMEQFWADEDYSYWFPCSGNTATVHYSDGTSQPLAEALEQGNADVTELDRFGIYYTRRLNVNATYIRADSCKDGAYERLLEYAANRDKMSISSVQHIPALSFQMDTDWLDRFRQELREYYQFHRSYDGQPSFLEQTEKYDWLWFQDHGLLILAVSAGSGAIRHEVVSLDITEGEFTGKELGVEVRRIIPEGVMTADVADWFILLELPREELRTCNAMDAWYIS